MVVDTVLLILYLPVYFYTWRRLLRGIANNPTWWAGEGENKQEHGIETLYDLGLAVGLVTLIAWVAPIYFVATQILSYIDHRIRRIGVDSVVRLLAGEDERVREDRVMRDKLSRAAWIVAKEKEHSLGEWGTEHVERDPIEGEVLDDEG